MKPRSYSVCGLAAITAMCQLACGDSVRWFAPPVPEAASAIAAVEVDGKTRIIAYDLTDDVALVERLDAKQLVAAFPPVSLAELGLVPGVVSPPDDGIALDAYPVYRFEDDVWSETSAPPALRRAILPHPNPCIDFVRRWSQPLDALNDAHHAIRLGEETVLITALDQGEVFLLEGEQAQKLEVRPSRRIAAMTRSSSGEIWTFSFGGKLSQAELLSEDAEPFLLLSATTTLTPDGSRPVAMAARSGPNPEIVMVIARGVVLRWDAEQWTEVYDLGTNVLSGTNVVLDDAGDFWVSTNRAPSILRVRNGVATDTAPRGLMDGVSALALLPEFGLTALTTAGKLMMHERERWETIDGPFSANNKYALLDYRGGVLYGGTAGFVGQYRIPSEYCPETLVAQGSVKHIMEYRGGLLLVVDGRTGQPPAVEVVDPRF